MFEWFLSFLITKAIYRFGSSYLITAQLMYSYVIDAKARTVNTEMMVVASKGIVSCVSKEELSRDYILPYPYDRKAHVCVAKSVKEAAIRTGVCKK